MLNSWKSRTFRPYLVACLFTALASLAAWGGLGNEVFGQEDDKADRATSEQESEEDPYGEMTFEEIGIDFTTNMRAYTKRYRAAPTAEEKRAVARTIPSTKVYQARLMELINADPGSEAGLEIVDWWYRRGGRRLSSDVIIRLILKNYFELETIEKYVPRVTSHLETAEAEGHLRSLIEASPFDSVRASATYYLHESLRKRAEELEGHAAQAVNAEVKSLRDTIFEHYADAGDPRGAKFVDLLDAVEFATRLEIGKPVPDIVGTDLDGVDFKLSDYDGKVRVISFWGDW